MLGRNLDSVPFVAFDLSSSVIDNDSSEMIRSTIFALASILLASTGTAFSPLGVPSQTQIQRKAQKDKFDPVHTQTDVGAMLKVFAAAFAASVILGTTSPVYADEFGRETEAPTLFTGETVQVRTLGVLEF